jgi:hypothetical protein
MSDPDDFRELCDAAVEGRLTPEQRARLEERVLRDASARRYYAEVLHDHAGLSWAEGFAAERAPAAARFRRRFVWAASAAAVLVAAGLWLTLRAPATVATLARTTACTWESTSSPTEAGAQLSGGWLRLREGLATVVFDGGAEVTLEGPAALNLVSSTRCLLQSGRLVAKAAKGFAVETPNSTVEDLGTEFGVHIRDVHTTDVQVFKGLVEVVHRASGRRERIATGKNLRVGREVVTEIDAGAVELPPDAPALPEVAGSRLVQISTAAGRGRDAYVHQVPTASVNRSDVLLLVKNTAESPNFHRKAYASLDLAAARGTTVVQARLVLACAPTGMGYSSRVPDATFAVYGLIDESGEAWEEAGFQWSNAPANGPGGAEVDPKKTVKLGTFVLPQGVQTGTVGIDGPALVDFLNRDTNSLATFIIVRETMGTGQADLVHGFASRRHPSLPGPTLQLTVVPRRP